MIFFLSLFFYFFWLLPCATWIRWYTFQALCVVCHISNMNPNLNNMVVALLFVHATFMKICVILTLLPALQILGKLQVNSPSLSLEDLAWQANRGVAIKGSDLLLTLSLYLLLSSLLLYSNLFVPSNSRLYPDMSLTLSSSKSHAVPTINGLLLLCSGHMIWHTAG